MDLTLILKGEYFDQIKTGTKPEEFRAVTPYWTRRLAGRTFDRIVIKRGYAPRGDDSRTLVRPWLGCTTKTITHPHFGPESVQVYAIRVNPDPTN